MFVVCMSSTIVLMWARGRVEQKRSLTFYVFGQIRNKCFSSSTFPKSQPRQNLSAYGTPFHAPSTASSYVLPHRNRARAFRSWTVAITQVSFTFVRHTLEVQVSFDFLQHTLEAQVSFAFVRHTLETQVSFAFVRHTLEAQISFAFVRHTLEAQVSCLHAGPNLTIGKKKFNESQSHIILHPFYIQHCVRKTWRGWDPNFLVDRASRRRSTTN